MKALNRIVTALLAAAIFPVAYFTDIITVYAHANLYDSNIVEALSIKRIIELFTGDGLFADLVKGGASELPDGLLKFKGNFIAFVVFFAIALLVALATVIVAAATNSRKATASLGAAGLLSIIGMRIAFSAVSSASSGHADPRLTDRHVVHEPLRQDSARHDEHGARGNDGSVFGDTHLERRVYRNRPRRRTAEEESQAREEKIKNEGVGFPAPFFSAKQAIINLDFIGRCVVRKPQKFKGKRISPQSVEKVRHARPQGSPV